MHGTVLAGTSPEADGEHFNIVSHIETTVGELVSLICKLTGLAAPTMMLMVTDADLRRASGGRT